jgi:hypothetical protein
VTDGLAELLSLERGRNSLVERALRDTDHLRRDTHTSLVQNLDGIPAQSNRVSST